MARVANSKAVAVQDQAGLPAVGYDYGEDAHVGFEGTTGKDLSIPFIQVLQSNSPQVEDQSPEGSAAGELYNTVTRERVGGQVGIPFLPVHKEVAAVEWTPRDKGGGFVGLYEMNGPEYNAAVAANGGNKFGKLPLKNGNELIETHYIYGLLLDEKGTASTGFGVLSFTSTKIKVYRDFTTAMYTLKGRPPMFANRALIKTVKQKNEKGTYFNYQIDPLRTTWMASLIDPATERALLEDAKGFREMVISGLARAAFESQVNDGAEPVASGGGGKGGDPEKAPF